MKKLNKQQLILLANRLIDDASKVDPVLYTEEKFTGGAVLTAFHYGKISYKVDLYFGYGKGKNPIHYKANISEEIACFVFDAINEKCKDNIDNDTYSVDLLKDILNTSLRSSTTPYKEKTRRRKEVEGEIVRTIEYLNLKANTNFRTTSKTHSELIGARLSDGYTLEDLKSVVTHKCREWKNDPKMKKFLRPDTLFNKTKFENYIGLVPKIEDDPRNATLEEWEKNVDPYQDPFATGEL